MNKRKLTFNIHEDPDKCDVVTPQLLQHVLKETPFPGAIVWELTNGKQLNAFRRDYVKSEIYDVWISEQQQFIMKEKEPPYIDDRYYCAACGSHSHRCDPRTGCCYECGADNWEPEPDKYDEIF